MSRAAAAGLALAGLLLPPAAQAHGLSAGQGPFVDGLLHPLLVPAHLLALAGLGLWAAQQRRDGLVLAAFAGLLALGLAIAGLRPVPAAHAPALLLLAATAGLLTAAARRLPRAADALLAALTGLAVGIDSPVGAAGLRSILAALAGTWIGAGLVLLNVIALAGLLRRPWLQVGARIAGSWVAAAALLVLALALRA